MKPFPKLEFTRNPSTGAFSYDPAALALAKQWVEQREAEYAADPQKRVVDKIKDALFVPSCTIRAGNIEATGATLEEAVADFKQKTGGRYTLHFGQNDDTELDG